ncbi:hypothetical protein SAMN04487926_1355 [Paraburkholderia steynii]|uniref:Uncharacterized protein n=1 Tax=Paraburkholderia steynii TaxID=1245441 RepID=A0A7Z7FLR7_9BURK|nr:hypothetical protein [Paraburkholderia steynii]SDJ14699.1 hypothetical protein SAMN04487926_1355 [Paraburkholderia steynii]
MVVKPARLRPQVALIVEALELSFAPRPKHHVEFEALDKTLLKEVKRITKREHLRLLKNRDPKYLASATYQRLLEKYSGPVYLRVCEWGIFVFEDKSSMKHGQFHFCVKLKFLPDAIVNDPFIIDDISTPHGYQALDLVITDLMRSFIHEQYDGPGSIDLDEGDHFAEAMTFEIEGDGEDSDDHDLDTFGIAEGLKKLLCDGKFDRYFLDIVKKTQKIHAKYGRLKS